MSRTTHNNMQSAPQLKEYATLIEVIYSHSPSMDGSCSSTLLKEEFEIAYYEIFPRKAITMRKRDHMD